MTYPALYSASPSPSNTPASSLSTLIFSIPRRPFTSLTMSPSTTAPLDETPVVPQVVSEMHNTIFKALHEAKEKKGMTFEQIAKATGRSEVYTAAM